MCVRNINKNAFDFFCRRAKAIISFDNSCIIFENSFHELIKY